MDAAPRYGKARQAQPQQASSRSWATGPRRQTAATEPTLAPDQHLWPLPPELVSARQQPACTASRAASLESWKLLRRPSSIKNQYKTKLNSRKKKIFKPAFNPPKKKHYQPKNNYIKPSIELENNRSTECIHNKSHTKPVPYWSAPTGRRQTAATARQPVTLRAPCCHADPPP